ncbi:MAG: MBL fold metallo-hydrolase [Gemmatimonadota bacterium]|nr:MBL fold metallo-hydrolase [Gemmatimonadota bacterium]MDE2985582.1 MBL fold metallo-hydrolase [Gemmatimonadota bacterium]
MSRRRFLAASAGCAGYLAAAGPLLPPAALGRWRTPRRRIVAQEPFARIEDLGLGMFAIVSTPLDGDYTTVCNGGIIMGRTATLVVEAFASPEGAAWVCEQALELTGGWPTHVVVTHYHRDHAAGAGAFARGDGTPHSLHATEATRDLVLDSRADEELKAAWADAVILAGDAETGIDLGGRVATVVPRGGHTASDVTVEVDGGEGPVWCGDLVWNAMFPNYMDAEPTRLARSVYALHALRTEVFVPGHGPLADVDDVARYIAMIDVVGEYAREVWRLGMTAEEAASRFQVPEDLGEWVLFDPGYYQRAIEAWMDEIVGDS